MTSQRRRRANRKNARRSTGPRTAAGKDIAARNAFRHGLAADIRNNPTWSKDIETLALYFYEEAPKRHRFVHAKTAAEAQFAINRVRQARVALIEHAAIDHETHERPLGAGRDDRILPAICRVTKMLLQFDRYERRALSRRKKAIRALIRP